MKAVARVSILTTALLSVWFVGAGNTVNAGQGLTCGRTAITQMSQAPLLNVHGPGAAIAASGAKPAWPDNTPPPTSKRKKNRGNKAESQAYQSPPEPTAPPVIKIDGPSYYVIPLHGSIGRTVQARLIARSLADALKRAPDVVILEVNSPGGLISEADSIINLIRRYNGRLRIVAYADRALSAAAMISMSAKEIYMRPSGIIGAATAYKVSMLGLPEDISEKFQSVWRALARSCAETGGHNPLLAEAMIDKSLELHLVQDDGGKFVREGRGRKTISRKDRVLTLTASEAVACGLAAGKASGYGQLRKLLGFEKWTECEGLGRPLAKHWADISERFEKEIKEINNDYLDNMLKAKEALKERASYQYNYYRQTERLTPRSQKRWRDNSMACVRHLRKAEKKVKQALKLAKSIEGMDPMVKQLESNLKEVKNRARKIYRSANTYDVPRQSR